MAKRPVAPDTHEHDDHCVCDIELHDDEVTSDADLPVAAGGVEPSRAAPPDADADGCDLDFTSEPTTDEELPAATGGVA